MGGPTKGHKTRDLVAESIQIINGVDLVHLVKNYEELVYRGGYYRGANHDSLIVDPKSQKFWWNSQNQWGSAVDWIIFKHNMSYKDAIQYLGNQMPSQRIPPVVDHVRMMAEVEEIELGVVISLARNAKGPGKEWWHSRGVYSDELIENLMLGIDKHHSSATIPVWDEDERLTNIKHRSLLEHPDVRYWNHSKGRGFQLYDPGFAMGLGRVAPGEQLVIVAGEIKAIVLLQNGIRAVSSTGGCGSFSEKWLPLFRDREMIICYDPKEIKNATLMEERIRDVAKSTRILELDGDVDDLLNAIENTEDRKTMAARMFA